MYRPCTNSAGMKGFVCDPSMGMRTLAAACNSDYGMAPRCGSHPQGKCPKKEEDEEPFVALSATGTKWLLLVFFLILLIAMFYVWRKTKKSYTGR